MDLVFTGGLTERRWKAIGKMENNRDMALTRMLKESQRRVFGKIM